MDCYTFNEKEILTVDIHKYTKLDAKFYLERLLVNVEPSIKEIIVIHGYHNGIALQTMVRKELKSKRIKRRFIWLNPGRTSLILN